MATLAGRGSMRERFREQVREDVKAAALEQLAAGGAHAISINAISKELGVSGSALYRYFPSRDDLLTALVIDAYEDLRDTLAQELGADAPDRTPEDRFRALTRAYRAWAVAQPHRYELLFKPPIPGYDAHSATLANAARSLMAILLSSLAELTQAGDTRTRPYQNEEVLAARTAGAAEFRTAVAVWSCLHGIVSLELGGGLAAMTIDTDTLFEHEIQVLIERIGRQRG
ncbi:TetR/AcrR family transcriptional regulator [Nonomuraea sp. NPDC049725]|uniref:TetR/AcrR family transcriptional regulator n=1 Tax=Nonomuraea sp. NPDC049725 TaxID=3154508 RepID=UPI0034256BEF